MSPPVRTPRLTWAALAGATLVALALRAVFVGDQSIGYEEVFTLDVVSHATLGGVWRAIHATESTPPLYYALTWAWVHLTSDDGVVSLRIVSLLAGTLTVPAAFLAARRFVGERAALATAWLAAISPWLVEESIYARSYALLVLVGVLSLWALGAVLEQPTKRHWALWALAAIACVWTHYFTLYLLAGEVLVLALRLPQARRAFAVALGAVLAGAAPLWTLFHSQSGASERTSYIAAEPLHGRLEGIVRQFAMGTNVPSKWLEAAGIAVVLAALLFTLATTCRRPTTLVLVAVALIGAGLPVLAALTGVDDHLLPRNIIAIWIAVAPLVAYGLTRARAVPLLAYSALCLLTAIWVQANWRYQGSPDWHGASIRVAARAAGDPIAVEPGIEVIVAEHYLHRRAIAAPLRTGNLWVMVEPARGPHQRALTAVAYPPLAPLWGSAFRTVGEIDYRGFRLIHLHATTPTVVSPAPADNGPATNPTAAVLGP